MAKLKYVVYGKQFVNGRKKAYIHKFNTYDDAKAKYDLLTNTGYFHVYLYELKRIFERIL